MVTIVKLLLSDRNLGKCPKTLKGNTMTRKGIVRRLAKGIRRLAKGIRRLAVGSSEDSQRDRPNTLKRGSSEDTQNGIV